MAEQDNSDDLYQEIVDKAEVAQSSDESSKRKGEHLAPYRFRPGQSGNPGGRIKKKPVTEIYESILGDPECVQLIEQMVIKALKKGNMAAVLQLKEMTDRVEGKVTQTIEADVTVANSLSERMAKARERAGSGGH